MKIANSLGVGLDRFDQADIARRIAEAGFDGLDFNYFDLYTRPEWQDQASAEKELDALAAAASETGAEWVQAHGPFVIGPANPTKDDEMIESCTRSVRACARLGAPWMVLHPFWWDGAWDRAHHEAVLAANVGFFRALLTECESARIGIALENIFDSTQPRSHVFGSVPEDLWEIADALDHDLVGFCWDTGHAHILKLDQRAALKSLGPRLKALHLHDNDGARDYHVLPFTTAHMGIDWVAVTKGIAEAEYEGAITLEASASLRRMPEVLFDETLALSASIARHLAEQVEKHRVSVDSKAQRADSR